MMFNLKIMIVHNDLHFMVKRFALYLDDYLNKVGGKFHPRYFPVEFAGIFRPGKYAQSGKYGKYGKYDFGLVIM